MLANNEIGTVQPVAEVSELVRRPAPGAAILVDAVHAVGWLDVADLCGGADMLLVSAHKFRRAQGDGCAGGEDRDEIRASRPRRRPGTREADRGPRT